MLDLALPAFTAPAAWWPSDARYAADFVNRRYMSAGQHIGEVQAFALSRASEGLALNGAGQWLSFGPDVARLTDLGLTIEAAASNVLWPSTIELPWSVQPVGTPFAFAGSEAAGFTMTCQSAFTGLPTLERYGGWGPVPAATLASYAFDLHNSGMAMAAMWHANIGYVASWNAATGTASGAGATIKPLGGGWYRCFLAKTQPQDNIAIRIKPGGLVSQTYAPGDFIKIRAPDIQLGAVSRGYIRTASGAVTRSADSLMLYLPPAAAHDLVVTFEDGSQQVVPGIAGGDYGVGTGLNRACIASIIAKPPS